ncbi:hypothetical protein Tco_0653275 [Tanacetum coccineum]|uniref:Reverse transcriptase domain-containing protein n=1 Tax=Tanacetum coccineum TaxID=301880 RepID=A0ABQ4WZX4_9ASTR
MRTRSQNRNRQRQQQQVPPIVVEPLDLEDPIKDQDPLVVTMADNRTMEELLQAPTEGYEDAIVVPAITADNFKLKHSLLTLVQNNRGPRDCLCIIESKSKVRHSRSKAIVAKVSTSTSTPGISSDVAELKDMVKALLLDKKNQNQTPAPTPVKAVEQSCVTCGGAHSYRKRTGPPNVALISHEKYTRSTCCIDKLRVLANSTKLRDQLLVYFDMHTQKEAQLVTELSNLTRQFVEIIDERRSFIQVLERLPINMLAYKTREELKGLPKGDLIKATKMRKVALQLRLQLRKIADTQEGGEESLMSTQEYIRKVIEDVGEDDDFTHTPWLSVLDYVNVDGGIVTGCFGDVKKFLKN